MKENKLIRDLLGNPIPQHYNVEKGIFIANTNGTGDATNVDFSKIKMLRDLLGSPIPQYYDVGQGKFVPSTSEGSGGGGEVGPQGPPGEKGEPGEPGPPGSDANVTSENITNALGFTPASSTDLTEEVERLTTHLDETKGIDIFELYATQSVLNAEATYPILAQTKSKYCAFDSVNKRINFNEIGVYLIEVSLVFTGNATGRRELHVRKNTTTIKNQVLPATESANSGWITLSAVVLVTIDNTSDYISAYGVQTSGNALNIEKSSATHVNIKRLGGV